MMYCTFTHMHPLRLFLQSRFGPLVNRLARRFSSRPDEARVHASLDRLLVLARKEKGKRIARVHAELTKARFIIFSDQHKGAKNGSDDFMPAEASYLGALEYYYGNGYTLISLGDEEELWENLPGAVRDNNPLTIASQQRFVDQDRFYKVFGNHDLYWHHDPLGWFQLKKMYGRPVPVYEAIWLQLQHNGQCLPVLLTHGHQGDGQSDGNWFSAWFVSRIWAPLQAYLGINPNTPAVHNQLKTLHNQFMYAWSNRPGHPILITGHTHQPVFASLTLLEKLYRQLETARQQGDQAAVTQLELAIRDRSHEAAPANLRFSHLQPVYFNTGCCCFADGDITGIEMADGKIRLVKWQGQEGAIRRDVLEECGLEGLKAGRE